MKSIVIVGTILLLALAGCEKKIEPVPVGQMSEYRDPGYGFRIQYPADWRQLGNTGKAVFVRSQEVSNKFLDPTTGEEGGQVTVEVLKLGGKPAADVIASSKEELKQLPTIALS